MAFNRQIWLETALIALISYSGMLTTLNFKVDASENEKVTVPVFNAGDAPVKGDADTTFDSLNTAYVEVDTTETMHKGWRVTKKAEKSTNLGLVEEAMTQGVDLVMSAVEKDVMSYMASNASTAHIKQFTEVISGDTGLTYENILRVKTLMTKALCPLSDRYMVINADKQEQLELIVDKNDNYIFLEYTAPTGDQLARGEIGMVKGFKVIVTENAPLVTTAGAYDETTPANNTQDCVLFYHTSSTASAVDESSLDIESEYNLTKRSWDIVCDIFYGKEPVRPTWIFAMRDNT